MCVPTLFTADAGQAYEMIKPLRIDRAFRIIFRSIQIVCKKEDPTISCIHSSKAKARIGGWITDRLWGRSVLYLSKISHCMRSLSKLRWYKIGYKYLYQKIGIPIGGPVSGAILEAVFFMDEYSFDKFGWEVFLKSCNISGPMDFWLTVVRYVDDLFFASRWSCPKCIETLVHTMYSKTARFDPANEGLTVICGFEAVKFLDLWCYMSWHKAYFCLSHKNDRFFFFRPC